MHQMKIYYSLVQLLFSQERKGPKNRPKHTRKRIHQAKKNFLEKFKTASKYNKFVRPRMN